MDVYVSYPLLAGWLAVKEGVIEESIAQGSGGPGIRQSLRDLIEILRTRYSAKTILIEAGPTLS
jgi:hypothetical protein